jgi:6-pyruvoyltetrahydropterin/6-carboxytetrahydropterin synthase
MKVELSKRFEFSADHRLPAAGAAHPCARIHGHSFVVEVTVAGEVDPRTGWLMDFGDLRAIVEPVVKGLDHSLLNDVTGLSNPTSENLARWIWDRLAPHLRGLAQIAIEESPSSRCAYRGED